MAYGTKGIRAGDVWLAVRTDKWHAWKQGEEVVVEPCGYLHGSPPAAELVAFKVKGTEEVLEINTQNFLYYFSPMRVGKIKAAVH